MPQVKNIFMSKLFCCIFLYSVLLFTGLSCSKAGEKAFTPSTGTGGSMARFTIVGKYMYIVDKTDLKVFDLSFASRPVLKSSIPVGFEIETIFPFKDKLFIGSTSAVHIFSIENPEKPQKLSEALSPEVLRRCDPVVARDSVAYATLRTSGQCGGWQSILAVYDIRDELHPVQVNNFSMSEPYGLGYQDSALYVCDLTSLMVYDIRKPFEPVLVRAIGMERFIDVIPYDNTLVCWTDRGMTLYDISDRFDPQLITQIF
jgi:hypothetical protein